MENTSKNYGNNKRVFVQKGSPLVWIENKNTSYKTLISNLEEIPSLIEALQELLKSNQSQ